MNIPPAVARGLFRAVLAVAMPGVVVSVNAQSLQLPNPVMFVTQVPVREKTNTVTSVGGNHLATTPAAPRGGDLMIKYTDGTVKNLTQSAGYGETGVSQGASAIAVRDPHIHWSGQRAVFSMVIGTAASARWQLYEITRFGQFDTPIVTRIPNQPAAYNNVQPCYTSTDNIVFVSDRPRDGSSHLYPALDEKSQGAINTGLWQLNAVTGTLTLLEHSPSGSFDPFVDTYGRIVFSRWDHLQRDELTATAAAGAVDYSSEAPAATVTPGQWLDLFPEPLPSATNPLGLKFDQFLPWTINQDGTDLVTINHLGRHEMTPGFTRSLPDSNLVDFAVQTSGARAGSFLQIRQVNATGSYVCTDAAFTAVSAGRLLMFQAAPSRSPATGASIAVLSMFGLARDAVMLPNGRLLASVSPGAGGGVPLSNVSYGGGGVSMPPDIPLDSIPPVSLPFKLRVTSPSVTPAFTVNLMTAPFLNPDIVRTVKNPVDAGTYDFTGPLWELQPVEVTSLPRPAAKTTPIDRPELEVFQRTGVSPAALRAWMTANDLAVISTRNVTTRDGADKQQPISLKVAGGTETIAPGNGPVYTVSSVQFFQADYVRGYGISATDSVPDSGRRVTARVMHDDKGANPVSSGGPGHVNIAADGSIAAFVPAQRGLTWHLASPNGDAVVRERYWLSFTAGEIRACTSCHGVNSTDQAGHTVSTNPPDALKSLLDSWKQTHPESAAGSFRIWSEATHGVTLEPDADNDGDGLSNFVEYASGSSPLTAPASGSEIPPLQMRRDLFGGEEENILTLRRSPVAWQLETAIEASSDLSAWSEIASLSPSAQRFSSGVTVISSSVGGGFVEELQLVDQSSAAPVRRYYRLRMQAP